MPGNRQAYRHHHLTVLLAEGVWVVVLHAYWRVFPRVDLSGAQACGGAVNRV